MTDPIYRCPDHGVVTPSAGTGSKCPECGQRTEKVLSGDRRRRLSKFVSGALRHFPEDAEIELDDRGWAEYDALADAVARKYDWADSQHLGAVVETDPKGRFERTQMDGRTVIRASYGHSVDVELGDGNAGRDESGEKKIPDRLYHGTDPANLDSILAEGLKPMGRQEVHLSGTPAEAREVGRRHTSNPVVLEIDAETMVADGHRVSKRGTGTYTTESVPPEYLGVERK